MVRKNSQHNLFYTFVCLCVCGCLQTVSAAESVLLQAVKGDGAQVETHRLTGKVNYIGAPAGKPLSITSNAQGAALLQAAPAVALQRYAPLFGFDNPSQTLTQTKQQVTDKQHSITRYQQSYHGVPVIGGEVVVNLDAKGQMLSMNGEASPNLAINTEATITATNALYQAREAVARWYQLDPRDLSVSTPQLSIYDSRLITPGATPVRLVWKMEVMAGQPVTVREYVLLDAHNGDIRLHFNQIETARNRLTYTANNTASLPGSLVCNESQPNCSNGADKDADAAHKFAGDTYDFYNSEHGRDGIDNAGGTIISTVDWTNSSTGQACANAFWNSTQMVYCDTFSLADDVVGHELTHGVTEHESGLLYYYESGAINESFSDVWGEFVDLTNSSGSDAPADRWLMGEDLPGIGAIRDMQNPPAKGDPDRMRSTLYSTSGSDSGGVHTNSGVNNKAVYLMTDGDTFNGKTISPLGISKVAAVYYEAQAHLLTTGSNYLDLYHALDQACQNLIGSKGIVAADCQQVKNATEAVEMNLEPQPGFVPQTTQCPGGQKVQTSLFSDDLESGTGKWGFASLSGTTAWSSRTNYATSKTTSLFARDPATLANYTSTMKNSVAVPSGTKTYLYFRHAFGFETNVNIYNDGGKIEYSINGGATWLDASSLFDDGRGYNGSLATGTTNPDAGNPAFVNVSHGYVSSRYDLSSLAGQNVRVRFRMTSNNSLAGPLGWYIDDISIHSCVAVLADAGSDKTANSGELVSLDGSNSFGNITSYSWTQTGGSSVTLSGANTAKPSFTTPATPGQFTFELTVTIGSDSAKDTVVITTQTLQANAGADQTVNPGTTVSLDGSSSGGVISSYSWTQTAGTTVTIINATTVTPSFISPASDSLTFQLTVSSAAGNSASDSIVITLNAVTADAGPDQVVNIGSSVNLDATNSSGNINSYNWTQTSGTTVTLNDATGATPNFAAPNLTTNLEFELTVEASSGATSKDTVIVTVKAPTPIDNGGISALNPFIVLTGLLLVLWSGYRGRCRN